MKRSLVALSLVVGVVALWVARSDRGVRTGIWSGRTSQGLPVQLTVGKGSDGRVIEEWRMRFDSRCQGTGRVLRVLVASRARLPIADGRFAHEFRFVGIWDRMGGVFAAGDEARGSFSSNWAALTGAEFRKLGAENCKIDDLDWVAHPGRTTARAADAAVDIELIVEPDGNGSVVVHPPATGAM